MKENPFSKLGGIEWAGDADNERIFGTSWMDNLFGEDGDDNIQGFEGSDWIAGGSGKDRLFGDGGDDVIFTGYGTEFPTETGLSPWDSAGTVRTGATGGDGDFASGGSGNDKIYGDAETAFAESLFGGSGHDKIYGYDGADYL